MLAGLSVRRYFNLPHLYVLNEGVGCGLPAADSLTDRGEWLRVEDSSENAYIILNLRARCSQIQPINQCFIFGNREEVLCVSGFLVLMPRPAKVSDRAFVDHVADAFLLSIILNPLPLPPFNLLNTVYNNKMAPSSGHLLVPKVLRIVK